MVREGLGLLVGFRDLGGPPCNHDHNIYNVIPTLPLGLGGAQPNVSAKTLKN